MMPPVKPPRLTVLEAGKLKRALGAAALERSLENLLEIPAEYFTAAGRAELAAAIDRVTITPAECSHDDWEWPMHRCPTCGTDRAVPR